MKNFSYCCYLIVLLSSCLSLKVKNANNSIRFQVSNNEKVNNVPVNYYLNSIRHNDSIGRIYNEWRVNHYTYEYIDYNLMNYNRRRVNKDILNILNIQKIILTDTTLNSINHIKEKNGYLYPEVQIITDTILIYYKYTNTYRRFVYFKYGQLAYFTRYLLPYIYFPIEMDLPQSRIYFTILVPKEQLMKFQTAP